MNVRRPMVWIVLAVIAGSTAAFYVSVKMAVGLVSIAAAAVFVNNRNMVWEECRKQMLLALFLLLFFVAGFSRLWVMETCFERLTQFDGREMKLSGLVIQSQIKEESIKLIMDCGQLDTRVLVQFRSKQPQRFFYAEGQVLQVSGRVQLPPGAANPGGFDYGRYLKGKRVGLQLFCEQGSIRLQSRQGNGISLFLEKLCRFRSDRRARLLQLLGEEEGGLLIGMLLGDKSVMEDEVYESFQKNGIAHILCVSGVHISIVCGCMERLLVGRNKRVRGMAMLTGLFLYAALASFAPSVMRAVLMVGTSVIGRLFLQRYDRLSALCFSCFLMTMYNPYLIFQTGFQLSYLAVASLAVVLPRLESMAEKLVMLTGKEWIRPISAAVAPLIALQAVMAPITAYLFQYFSLSAFFLNGPILVTAGIAIPLGMILLLAPAWCFASWLAVPLHVICFVTKVLVYFMQFISKTASTWEGTSFSAVSPALGLLFLFYGMAAFLCWEERHMWKRKGMKRQIAAAFLTVTLLSSAGPWMMGLAPSPVFWSRQQYDLVFVDVGQGDCLHIRTPSGKNILIDGGGSKNYEVGKKTLLPYLLKNGVSTVDLAVVTHLHDDHFLGIRELSQLMNIRQLALHDMNRYRQSECRLGGKKKTELLFLGAGDRILLDEDVWIDVLWPQKQEEAAYGDRLSEGHDENDNSLLLQISYRGTKVLVTGDMGKAQEEEVLRLWGRSGPKANEARRKEKDDYKKQGGGMDLQSDILKVGHHGSPYSTGADFVHAVAPAAAIIQVGKNNFGHPSAAVIELLRNYDIMVFRNDLQGAVMLKNVGAGTASVLTMQKTPALF